MGNNDNAKEAYYIPDVEKDRPHTSLLVIRKSRFLAHACHAPTPEAAREFVNSVRAANPQATHNCWAFVAGPPGSSAFVGSSDDGEPHGTAGRPMLAVLLGGAIGEICVVVSRWFGGIKLGTGGLARAYQAAVRENLAAIPIKEKADLDLLRVSLDYASINGAHRLLPDLGCKVIKTVYEPEPVLIFSAPKERRAELQESLAKLAGNKVDVSPYVAQKK